VVTGGDGVIPLHEVSEARARLAREPFGILDWTVDASTGRIHRGDTEVRLEPRVMDVLVYLASRPEEVVTRTELEDNVWTQVVVSYETLTSTVQKLRKAFNDDARNPRFIETLSKRGYRLIAPVAWQDNAGQSRQSSDPVDASITTVPRQRPLFQGALLILALVFVLGGFWYSNSPSLPPDNETRTDESIQPTSSGLSQHLPAKLSIAVLPFVNSSDDPQQEYFADGMTDDITTDLSKVSGLLVVARNSTFAYKGQHLDIRTIARELGVRYVVEGSVRKADGRVRITAQLINADTGLHVWADRYDRELKNIFALQDEVGQKIVEALKLKLTGTDKRRLAHQGTTNVAAYDLYLQGRAFESQFSLDSLTEALRLYGQATEIDPNYSDAYARMANVYVVQVTLGLVDDVESARSKAISLAERAIEVNAENPYAHWSLGQILLRHGNSTSDDFARSISEIERAIEIDPNYADAYAQLSFNYSGDGRLEIAMQSIETAMRLNPRYPFWYLVARGQIYYMQKNYKAAIADLEAAEERNPSISFTKWRLAAAYAQAGRVDDAEWQIDEIQNNGFNSNVDDAIRILALQHQVDINHYRDGLIKAGLPES